MAFEAPKARGLALLESIVSKPFFIMPAWLRIDPMFVRLQVSPRLRSSPDRAVILTEAKDLKE